MKEKVTRARSLYNWYRKTIAEGWQIRLVRGEAWKDIEIDLG